LNSKANGSSCEDTDSSKFSFFYPSGHIAYLETSSAKMFSFRFCIDSIFLAIGGVAAITAFSVGIVDCAAIIADLYVVGMLLMSARSGCTDKSQITLHAFRLRAWGMDSRECRLASVLRLGN
jgi:hypothetical protein